MANSPFSWYIPWGSIKAMRSHKHPCGYSIFSALPRAIVRPTLIVWLDGNKDSPTFREEITHCPGCGEKLTLASFMDVPAHVR